MFERASQEPSLTPPKGVDKGEWQQYPQHLKAHKKVDQYKLLYDSTLRDKSTTVPIAALTEWQPHCADMVQLESCAFKRAAAATDAAERKADEERKRERNEAQKEKKRAEAEALLDKFNLYRDFEQSLTNATATSSSKKLRAEADDDVQRARTSLAQEEHRLLWETQCRDEQQQRQQQQRRTLSGKKTLSATSSQRQDGHEGANVFGF